MAATTEPEVILGVLLEDPRHLEDIEIPKNLFQSEEQRRIYNAIVKRYQEIKDPDPLEISRNSGVKLSYLLNLTEGVQRFSRENFIYLVNKAKQKKLERELFKEFERQKNFFLKGIPTNFDLISDYLKKIKDLQSSNGKGPVLTSLQSVDPTPVEWLWYNRLPLGKLSLIVGDPGVGKSFLSIEIAASITKGRPWPDIGSPTLRGSVLILAAEDGLSDTIRIRAEKAEADLSRIHILEGIINNGKRGFFNLIEHVSFLEEAINKIDDLKLLIIDPITSYLRGVDSNKTTEVRDALVPLSSIAENYKISIIAISHLNKNITLNALYRATGSLAFVATARSVWAVIRDEDDPNRKRRFFTPLKTNLSINPSTLAFSIDDGRVIFEEQQIFDLDPDLALSPEKRETSSALKEAITWLKEALSDGPIPSTDIFRMAKANNIAEKTLRRAKERLGVQSFKEGMAQEGKWYWRLP